MRPQSIIGLIVAAVMIVSGLIVCSVAEGMAEKADIQLFAETENGTTRYKEPSFTDEKITKIEINVGEATVNVIGGSETSYVELLNFSENSFSYTHSGKTITVTEMADLSAVLKFWENGFAFKGMRNILMSFFGFGDKITGDKVVNVYLSDESKSLNNISITTTNGNIHLKDLSTESDYVLTLGSGDITVENISNASKLEIVADTDLNLQMNNAFFANLLINNTEDGHKPVQNGNFAFMDSFFSACGIYLKEGSVSLDFTKSSGEYSKDANVYHLTTGGSLTYLGNEKKSPFSYSGLLPYYRFVVVSEAANIRIGS